MGFNSGFKGLILSVKYADKCCKTGYRVNDVEVFKSVELLK